MARQTAIKLPDETFEELQRASDRTGRTTDTIILQAITQHLEDLEDLYDAEQATLRRQRGESKTHSLDEVSRELGLDD